MISDNTLYNYYVDNTTNPYNTNISWTYSTKVYLYQIFCPKPRCKGKMWAEIDAIVDCPKCGSRIKVVTEEPDYTVAVDKD